MVSFRYFLSGKNVNVENVFNILWEHVKNFETNKVPKSTLKTL